MPRTPIENFSYDAPDDMPGQSTAMTPSSSPDELLAFQVEAVIQEIRSSLMRGYQFSQRIVFESSTTFVVADYPGLRAVNVRLVGGGGGGGGADATSNGFWSAGGGGAGACYAEKWAPVADIPASVGVTVGSGGAGGTAAAGQDGGSSSFGSLCFAAGGGGGFFEDTHSGEQMVTGGNAGETGVGDLVIPGSDGQNTGTNDPTFVFTQPYGGASHLGARRRCSSSTGGNDGFHGRPYGSGGSGGFNDSLEPETKMGGNGSNGVVIVEIYV